MTGLYTHLAVAGAAAVLAWNAQGWRMGEDIAELREDHATALVTAVQAERDKKALRAAALQKESDDAQTRERAASLDADTARDAGERLRKQLATARAHACRNPAPATGGAPTDTADSVLADVQRRLDADADAIARFADAAHNAGTTCERSADAIAR